jgi:signal transduction histidine kinase
MQPDRKYKLELATGGGRLAVQIIGKVVPDELIDAEVKFSGVSFYQVNKTRQVISPLLVVPRGADYDLQKPAPENPFATPVLASASLLQFAPQGVYGHRVHLRGVVTHHRPGESLWIRDQSGGVRIQSQETVRLREGDVVDVLGFPTRGDYSPVLEDAVFRKTASNSVPTPVRLADVSSALNYDADLVEVTGKLTGMQMTPDGWGMVMQNGSVIFRTLLRTSASQLPSDWQIGSLVKVIGICAVSLDHATAATGVNEPNSFQVLLRSPVDLIIVKPPPWWTWQRLVWGLAAVAGGLVFAVATVIWIAKRRLREQAAQRSLAEAELTAILSERNRMAREIHDTLAQGLGAISMQLEVAKSRLPAGFDAATQSLEQAHSLVRDSLAEARTSIWNMRSQVLEKNDLPSALSGVLQQLTSGMKITTRFNVTGQARRLPPVTENNLLRIGQEAITNSVSHAHARRIEVELQYQLKQVQLTVSDDGQGFDTENPPKSESGFGLVGMRERAAELHGKLAIQSNSSGTRLKLSVPGPGNFDS